MFAALARQVCVARGIASVSVSGGLVTAQSLRDLYLETLRQLEDAGPAVFVVDFRRAVFLLTDADLNALLSGADPKATAPAAMVVNETYRPMFQAHSWAMAQSGVLRKTFTSAAAAQNWAQLRRDLLLPRTAP